MNEKEMEKQLQLAKQLLTEGKEVESLKAFQKLLNSVGMDIEVYEAGDEKMGINLMK